MFLKSRKPEIIWRIFAFDITALMLSYLIPSLLSKEPYLTYSSFTNYCIFFFITLSVTYWLKLYEDYWRVSIPFKKILMVSFSSYFIFSLVIYYKYFLQPQSFCWETVIFGFFIAVVFMATPRFFTLDKNFKKTKESLIVVGHYQSVINYFYFLQSEDYQIEQAIILNYNGPDSNSRIEKNPLQNKGFEK